MAQFNYIEVEMDMKVPFVDQLNAYGKQGYEFVTQAQRVEKDIDFKTGQRKVTIVIIFKKKEYIQVQPSDKDKKVN